MPGNEVADKLHNFFEQDSSPPNPQSYLRPILNNNSWVGTQRQNGSSLNSNSQNSARYLDSEGENGRQPSQMSACTNLQQFGLKPQFDSSHPRNQQLNVNGFMHDLQGSQTRLKQAEFLEDRMVSDRHSSLLGGLANFKSQQGNARNPERSEAAKVPVNFEFLGNQQQLMRSQHLGMSPHSRQHPGFSDMQLWQQQLMYKQLQEMQRQQQLQQLDQGTWLQNSHSQLSVTAKQAGADQLPALLNGVPINDLMGGEAKALLSPQMGIAGNLNWAQCSGSPTVHDYPNGVMFPNDQGQSMRSVGFVAQQLDLSLNGIPVSSTRISSNQYSPFQVMPPDCTDVMTKAAGNPVEKTPMRSAPSNSFQSDQYIHQNGCSQDCTSVDTQSFQGSLYGNASVQNLSAGVMSGDLQQANHLEQNGLHLEFQDREEHADWSRGLQEKAAAQVGPSHGVASLDPTEEKLLFGTGDDGTWDASFGSWSALVEDAVRCSSHDKGLQEERNCSSFQKAEPSTGIPSDVLGDNGKPQSTWDNKNLQRAFLSTSKPSPLFNDVDSSSNLRIAPSFQHSSTKSAYEQNDRVLTNASHESFQQLFKEAKAKQFDPSHKQRQFVEGDLQALMQMDDVNNGALTGNTYERSIKNVHSSEMDCNSQGAPGVWTHQQNMPFFNVSSQLSNKKNSWNANESLIPSGDDVLKVHDNASTKQYTQRNDELESDTGSPHIRTEDARMGHYDSEMSSNALKTRHKMNPQVLNRGHANFGKHVAYDSCLINKEDENMGKYLHQPIRGQQTWHSSLNRTEKGKCETSDSKQELPKVASDEDCTLNHHTDNGDSGRENSLSTGSEPQISVSEKSSGEIGRQMVPRRFQYHSRGNSGLNVEPDDSPSHTTYSQGLPHSVIGGFENQEQGNVHHAQFAGHVVSNNGMAMGKGQFINLQRNIKEAEEIQSRGTIPTNNSTASSSFGGSTAQFSQNNRTGQTSQNMLQLLHKVNQSRHKKNASRFGFSDRNTATELPEAAASGGFASRPQHDQSSSLQGFGLQLAPPSQWQQISNHALPSQTYIHESNTRQVDPETGDRDQTRSTSAASVQSLPHPHETSRRESWDNVSSGLTCKGTSRPSTQGSSFAVAASDPSYHREKLQQQYLQQQQYNSIASGREAMDPSVGHSFGSQAEINAHVKHASLLRQAHDSHDRAVTDKSAQTLLANVTGRIPPFRLASYADNRTPTPQFYTPDTGHSQSIDAGFYHPRSSGRQLPVLETRLVPQPSATSGMSHQAGFSTLLHNVRTNVSAHQRPSGVQAHNLTPNILQSATMLKNDSCTNSRVLQKADDRTNNGGSTSADIGACSINSQQFVCGEEHLVKDNSSQVPFERVDATLKKDDTSQGQESVRKHHTDGNSSVSISSLERLYQQDICEAKYGKDSSPNSQTELIRLPNVPSSSCGIGLYGHTRQPSNAQLRNYSLLQQMQAMKGADSDSNKRVGKKHKGADLGSDASHMDCREAPKFLYGHSTVFRLPVDGELAATSLSSLPPDVKMLSFSSRKNEEISASSQLVGREVSSQDICTSGQHELQNHTQSFSISSTSNFEGGSECQISNQLAPSWFERYGTYKTGQILDTYDGQRSAKASIQQFALPKVLESIDNNPVVDQRIDTGQAGSLRGSTSPTTMAADESSSPHVPSDTTNHNTVLRPKKRKSATSELLPWHKEVSHGSQRLQSISLAVLDWAQATNRLIEKVEDEAEMTEDDLSMSQSRRRLVLTTQLMQQLLPCVPAAVLAAEASSAYERVIYFVAKAALGDACSLIPYSRSHYRVHLDSRNMDSEKLKTSSEVGDRILSKIVEDFIGKTRKLEVDFSRLEKRACFVDIRSECQELERFSIINRLGKFHGRSQVADGVEGLSTSGAAPRRTFAQRYVTKALPMPGNLPEGVMCLSL